MVYISYFEIVLFIIYTLKTTNAFLLCLLQDCLLLKVPTHESKPKKFVYVDIPPKVWEIVDDCSILFLVDCLLTMLYAQLLSAFVERQHKERTFFHLSFGEMKIILDDVSHLFHPLPHIFFTTSLINQEIACIIAIHDLRVSEAEMKEEFKDNEGAHFCLSWPG